MTLPSIDKETYSSFTLHSAVVMVKGKNGNGIERKRTTSDARDGVEYNRKVSLFICRFHLISLSFVLFNLKCT